MKVLLPPVEEKGTGVVEALRRMKEDTTSVYQSGEKPKFPADPEAWRRYLGKKPECQRCC